jgi:uroporphyrinogen-III decarboxylase
MAGGLQTQLSDSETFDLEDPCWMGPYHYWHADQPFVKSEQDVRRICITPKEFYREAGYADYQRAVMDEVGGELALVGDCSSATLAFLVAMRGMTPAMYDLVERPAMVHAMMEKGVAIAAEKGKFNIDLGLKMLRINDSVANMSVISPTHWREFVFPHLRDLCGELHAYEPEVLLYCHICGNVLPIVEDLVDTGLDCIGPLDPLGGFSCAQVREQVGSRAALMGGVDTQSFVRQEPEAVEEESRLCMVGAGGAGGYVLGSGCVIPRTARRENLLALTRAADRYGRYSGGVLAETDS